MQRASLEKLGDDVEVSGVDVAEDAEILDDVRVLHHLEAMDFAAVLLQGGEFLMALVVRAGGGVRRTLDDLDGNRGAVVLAAVHDAERTFPQEMIRVPSQAGAVDVRDIVVGRHGCDTTWVRQRRRRQRMCRRVVCQSRGVGSARETDAVQAVRRPGECGECRDMQGYAMGWRSLGRRRSYWMQW